MSSSATSPKSVPSDVASLNPEAPASQMQLLRQRRFGPFFATQLTGAFADNLFKNLLVLLVTYQAARYSTLSPALLANLAAAIFILPFLLFSALGGQLADKFDKARLVRAIKLAEVGIVAVAAVGFVTYNVTVLLGALFLMGTHSAFFGPVKYSILPQVLRPDELVGGNGLLEMGTFLAILGGTISAGVLASVTDNPWAISGVLALVAILGAALSFAVPATKAAAPNLVLGFNPLKESLASMALARASRPVWLSLLGISWFWFFGAMLLTQFASYGNDVLGGDASVITLLLALFSVGVGVGSLLCEKLSGHRVEIGLVPFGSIGLSVFAIDLFFASPLTPAAGISAMAFLGDAANWRIVLDLVGIGLFGGFYIVPLYALVQSRTEPAHQSRVIAANNVLNALFMIGAAAISALFFALGATVPQLILACGVMNALVAIYIYALVPEFLWRFVDWLVVHTMYRVKVQDLTRIPETGGALVVCNHVSYVDALILAAYIRRPVRFVMDSGIFRIPGMGFLFRAVRAIPIAPAKKNPELLEKAYASISEALANGELVCIFPEGGLTYDGEMQVFKKGVERILAQNPVPVIPMALSGLWGGAESRATKPMLRRLASFRPCRRITLSVGMPQAPSVSADQLREVVQALRGDIR
jgi:1-acyl-sn-glycerol-3-phosphate acyltransferase